MGPEHKILTITALLLLLSAKLSAASDDALSDPISVSEETNQAAPSPCICQVCAGEF
jgi:hypothetical protein